MNSQILASIFAIFTILLIYVLWPKQNDVDVWSGNYRDNWKGLNRPVSVLKTGSLITLIHSTDGTVTTLSDGKSVNAYDLTGTITFSADGHAVILWSNGNTWTRI